MESDLDQQSESLVIQNNTVADVEEMSELEDGSNFQKNGGSYHNAKVVEDRISNSNAITKGLNLISTPELEKLEMSMGSKLERRDQISKTDDSTESNTNKASYGDSQKSTKAIDNMEEEILGYDSEVCISSENNHLKAEPSKNSTVLLKPAVDETVEYLNDKKEEIQPLTEGKITEPVLAEDNGTMKSAEIQAQVEAIPLVQHQEGESPKYLSGARESGYEGMSTAEQNVQQISEEMSESGIVDYAEEEADGTSEAQHSNQQVLEPSQIICEKEYGLKEDIIEQIQPLEEEKTKELPYAEESTTTATSIAPLITEDNSSTKMGEIQVQVEDLLQIAEKERESREDLGDEKESGHEGMKTVEPPIETARQSAHKIFEERSESGVVNSVEPVMAEDDSSTKSAEIHEQVGNIVVLEDQEGESAQHLSDGKELGYEGMYSAEPQQISEDMSESRLINCAEEADLTNEAQQSSQEVLEPSQVICQEAYGSKEDIIEEIQPLVEEKATELPLAEESTTAGSSVASLAAEDNSSAKPGEIQEQVADQEEESSLQDLSDEKESGYEGVSTEEPLIETAKQSAQDKIQPLVVENETELSSAEESTLTETSVAPLIAEENSSAKTGEFLVQVEDILQKADQEGASLHDLSDEKESGYEGMATAETPIKTPRQPAQDKIQPLVVENATELPSVEERAKTGTSIAPLIAEDSNSTRSGEILVEVADQEGESLKDFSDEKESEGMATSELPIETARQRAEDKIQPLVEENATEVPSAEESTKAGTSIASFIAEDNNSTKTGEIQVQVEDILQKVDQEGESLQDLSDEKESVYEGMTTVEPPIETARQSAQKIYKERSESGIISSVEQVIDEDDSPLKSAEIQVQVGNTLVLEDQEGESLQRLSDGKESGFEGMSTAEPVITIAEQNARQISEDMLDSRITNCAEEADLTNEAQQSSQEVLEPSQIVCQEAYGSKDDIIEEIQPLVEEKATELPSAEENTKPRTSIAPFIAEDNSSAKTGEIQVQVEDIQQIADQEGESLQDLSDEKVSGYEGIETTRQSAQNEIQPLVGDKATELPSAEESTTTGTSIAPLITEDNSSTKTGEIQVQVKDQEGTLHDLSDEKVSAYEGVLTAEPAIETAKQSSQDKIQPLVEENATELSSAEESTPTGTSMAPFIAEDNSSVKTGEIQVQVEDILQVADQEGESLQDFTGEKVPGYEGIETTEAPNETTKQSAQDEIQPLVMEKATELPSAEENTMTGTSIAPPITEDNSSTKMGEIQVPLEDILQIANQEGESLHDLSDEKVSQYEGITTAEPPIQTTRQSARDKIQPLVEENATELPSAEESTKAGTSIAPFIAEDNNSTKTGEIQVQGEDILQIADQEGESLQDLSDEKELGYESMTTSEPPTETVRQSAQKISAETSENGVINSVESVIDEDNSLPKSADIQMQAGNILVLEDQEGELPKYLSDERNSGYEGMSTAEPVIKTTKQNVQQISEEISESRIVSCAEEEVDLTSEAEHSNQEVLEPSKIICQEEYGSKEDIIEEIQPFVEDKPTELPSAEESTKPRTSTTPLIAEDSNSMKTGEIQVQVADQEGESLQDLSDEKETGYEGISTAEPPIETGRQIAQDKIQPLVEESATELPSGEENTKTGTSSAPLIAEDNSSAKTGEIQLKVADQEGESLQDLTNEKESEGMATVEPPIETAGQSIHKIFEETSENGVINSVERVIDEDDSSLNSADIQVQVGNIVLLEDQEGELPKYSSGGNNSESEGMSTAEPDIKTTKQNVQQIPDEMSVSRILNYVEEEAEPDVTDEAQHSSQEVLEPTQPSQITCQEACGSKEDTIEEIQPPVDEKPIELPSAEESTKPRTSIAPLITEENSSTKTGEIQVEVADQEGVSLQDLSGEKESGYEGVSTAEPPIETAKQSDQDKIQPLLVENATELPSVEESAKAGTSIAPLIAEDNNSTKTGEIQVQVEDILQIADQEGESLTDLSDEKESGYEGTATAEPPTETGRPSAQKISEERSESGVVNSVESVIAEDDSSPKSAEIQVQVGNILVLEDQEGKSAQHLSDGKESGYEGMSTAEPVITIAEQNARQISEDMLDSRITNYAEEADLTNEAQEVLETSHIIHDEAYSSKKDICEQTQPLIEEKSTELLTAEESCKAGNSIEQLIIEDSSRMKSAEVQVEGEDILLIAEQEGELLKDSSDGKQSRYDGTSTVEPLIETEKQNAQRTSEEMSESIVVNFTTEAQHSRHEVLEPNENMYQEAFIVDEIQPLIDEKETNIPSAEESTNTGNTIEPRITEDNSLMKSAKAQVQVEDILQLEDQASESPQELSDVEEPEQLITESKQNAQRTSEETLESRIVNWEEKEAETSSEAQHSSQEVLEPSQIICLEAYSSKEGIAEQIQPPLEEKPTELPSAEESNKTGNSTEKSAYVVEVVEHASSEAATKSCEVGLSTETVTDVHNDESQSCVAEVGEKEIISEMVEKNESSSKSDLQEENIVQKTASAGLEENSDMSDKLHAEESIDTKGTDEQPSVMQETGIKREIVLSETASLYIPERNADKTGLMVDSIQNIPLSQEDHPQKLTDEDEYDGICTPVQYIEKVSGYEGMYTAEPVIKIAKQNARQISEDMVESRIINCAEEADLTIEAQQSSQVLEPSQITCQEAYGSEEDIIEEIQPQGEEKATELPSVEENTNAGTSSAPFIAEDNNSTKTSETQVQVADQEGDSLQDLSDENESGYEGVSTAEPPTETAKQSAQHKIQPLVEENATELPLAEESTTTESSVASLIAEDNNSAKTGEIQVQVEDILQVADQEGTLHGLSDEKKPGYEGMATAELIETDTVRQRAQDKIQLLVEENATELPSAEESTKAATRIAPFIAEQNCSTKTGEIQVQVEDLLQIADQEAKSLQDLSDEKESGYEGMATAEPPIETARPSAQKISEERSESIVVNWAKEEVYVTSEAQHQNQEVSEPSQIICPKACGSKEDIVDSSTEGDNTALMEEKLTDSSSILKECAKTMESEVVEHACSEATTKSCEVVRNDESQSCLAEIGEKEIISEMVEKNESSSKSDLQEDNIVQKTVSAGLEGNSDMSDKLHAEESKDTEGTDEKPSVMQETENKREIVLSETTSLYIPEKIADEPGLMVDSIQKIPLFQEYHPQTLTDDDEKVFESNNEEFKINGKPYQPCVNEADISKHLDMVNPEIDETKSDQEEQKHESSTHHDATEPDTDAQDAIAEGFTNLPNEELKVDEKMEVAVSRIEKNILETAEHDSIRDVRSAEEDFENANAEPAQRRDGTNTNRSNNNEETDACKQLDQYGSNEFYAENPGNQIFEEGTSINTEGNKKTVDVSSEDQQCTKIYDNTIHAIENDETTDEKQEAQEDGVPYSINDNVLPDQLEELQVDEESKKNQSGTHEHGCQEVVIDQSISEGDKVHSMDAAIDSDQENGTNHSSSDSVQIQELERESDIWKYDEMDGEDAMKDKEPKGQEFSQDKLNSKIQSQITYPTTEASGRNIGAAIDDPEQNKSFEIVNDKAQILEASKTAENREENPYQTYEDCEHENDNLTERIHADHDQVVVSTDEKPAENFQEVHNVIQDLAAKEVDCVTKAEEYPNKNQNFDQSTEDLEHNYNQSIEEDDDGAQNNVQQVLLREESDIEKMTSRKESIGIATDGPAQNEPSEIENDKAHTVVVGKEGGFEAKKHIQANEDANHENDFSVEENIQVESADKLQYIAKSDVSCESSTIIPEVDNYGTADQGQVFDCKDEKPAEKLQEAHSENRDITIKHVDFVMDSENYLNKTQSIDQVTKDIEHNNNTDVNQKFQDTYVKSVKLNESSETESDNLEVQNDGREDEKHVCDETDETVTVTDTETANRSTKESLYPSENLDQEITTESIPYPDAKNFVTNLDEGNVTSNEAIQVLEQDEVAFKDPELGVKEESIDEAAKQESNKPNVNIKNMETVIKETNLEEAPQQSNDVKLLDISSVEESQQKDGKEENPSDLEDRDHLASRDYQINTQPTKAHESRDESVQEWEPNDVKQETASNVTISSISSHNVDEMMQTKGKQALGLENFSPTSFASKDTSTIQDNKESPMTFQELNNEKEEDPSSEKTTQKPYISEPTPRELHVETKGTNDPLDSEKTESVSSTNSSSSEIKSEASPQKKPNKALKVLSQIIHAPKIVDKHARKLLGMKKQTKNTSE